MLFGKIDTLGMVRCSKPAAEHSGCIGQSRTPRNVNMLIVGGDYGPTARCNSQLSAASSKLRAASGEL